MLSIMPKPGALGPMVPTAPETAPAAHATTMTATAVDGDSAPTLMPTAAPQACVASPTARDRYGPAPTNATAHAAPRYATATTCRSPLSTPNPAITPAAAKARPAAAKASGLGPGCSDRAALRTASGSEFT